MSYPPCQCKPPLLSFPLLSLLSGYSRAVSSVCVIAAEQQDLFSFYMSGLSLSAVGELCNDWSRVCVCVWGRFYSAWGVSQSVPSMVVADCFYTTSCSENLQ